MIQVLNRAFDIFEYISREPETPRTLGEITIHMAIGRTTCANIVKTLVNRHYLEKLASSRRFTSEKNGEPTGYFRLTNSA